MSVAEGGGLSGPGLQRGLAGRPAGTRGGACFLPPSRGGTRHSALPRAGDASCLEWKTPGPEVEGTTREDEEGGQESAASSLRNRRGEHGVPCASYVKRATGTAANGCAAHAGPPPGYANENSPRPMGGAGGGRSARGHVFHYVTAASQRWRRRRRRAARRLHAAHSALLSAAATVGASWADGRAHGSAGRRGRGSAVSARRGGPGRGSGARSRPDAGSLVT